MSQRTLYSFPLSGNAYKIRLLLSMLELDYQLVNIDLTNGENLTEEFITLNPRGQVPVYKDGENVIWDSMAILFYLAQKYGDGKWFPEDVQEAARVMQWLAVSENELLYGLARARATLLLDRPFNLAQCQTEGRSGLSIMEQHLTSNLWLAADKPTIADIACYPYVLMAPMGEISLDDYPNVQVWLERFAALPGWIAMQQ
ncbi:glutathione S-transferase family protein [Thiomicrorhabdus heinhorstiae]|uniref:Glutathione S-transferase family protein n=1 Tax=Thiomicrorhabdus heinhorstiae TaxID=2748010 RepID=A0ABS0BSB1_9GAMM|nr:glutathione S-transferase family protein [Thiomicrorhabdus heinhorstiae]MBF6056748.1 glutathione S-transferase family protein [Thiomicrorhabdus heinhorstiae]